jgi:thiamine-phosphate pyrophosphorylase
MANSVLPAGIYGITAEPLSNGRKNLEVVREMIRGGVKVVQYREKDNKTFREKLDECREIRKMTRAAGVLFVVDDHVDIAVLSDADGVHVGQEDIPVADVRKIAPGLIVGLSTHSPEQYRLAVGAGADYIGVGPVFCTKTKVKVCDPVGLEYVRFAASENKISFTALGGVKEHNIRSVVTAGAKTVCLVTEITQADDIAATVKKLDAIVAEEYRKYLERFSK